MVLDMATTEVPFFEIKNAKTKGIPLRKKVAVDRYVQPPLPRKPCPTTVSPTCCPSAGGFKGFGINLLIEMLTGALVERLLSTKQTPRWHLHEYGGLVLSPDIAGFTDRDTFKNAVSDMCRSLRNQAPADEIDRVAIPGDRSHEKLKVARKAGRIEFEDAVVDALNRFNP